MHVRFQLTRLDGGEGVCLYGWYRSMPRLQDSGEVLTQGLQEDVLKHAKIKLMEFVKGRAMEPQIEAPCVSLSLTYR